jgi:hypothetical protein
MLLTRCLIFALVLVLAHRAAAQDRTALPDLGANDFPANVTQFCFNATIDDQFRTACAEYLRATSQCTREKWAACSTSTLPTCRNGTLPRFVPLTCCWSCRPPLDAVPACSVFDRAVCQAVLAQSTMTCPELVTPRELTRLCCSSCRPSCDGDRLRECRENQQSLPICPAGTVPTFNTTACCNTCRVPDCSGGCADPSTLPPCNGSTVTFDESRCCPTCRLGCVPTEPSTGAAPPPLRECGPNERPVFNTSSCRMTCRLVEPNSTAPCTREQISACLANASSLRVCNASELPVVSGCCVTCRQRECTAEDRAACRDLAIPPCNEGETPQFDTNTCCPTCRVPVTCSSNATLAAELRRRCDAAELPVCPPGVTPQFNNQTCCLNCKVSLCSPEALRRCASTTPRACDSNETSVFLPEPVCCDSCRPSVKPPEPVCPRSTLENLQLCGSSEPPLIDPVTNCPSCRPGLGRPDPCTTEQLRACLDATASLPDCAPGKVPTRIGSTCCVDCKLPPTCEGDACGCTREQLEACAASLPTLPNCTVDAAGAFVVSFNRTSCCRTCRIPPREDPVRPCDRTDFAACEDRAPTCEIGELPKFVPGSCCPSCIRRERRCSPAQIASCIANSPVCPSGVRPQLVEGECCLTCRFILTNLSCPEGQVSVRKINCTTGRFTDESVCVPIPIVRLIRIIVRAAAGRVSGQLTALEALELIKEFVRRLCDRAEYASLCTDAARRVIENLVAQDFAPDSDSTNELPRGLLRLAIAADQCPAGSGPLSLPVLLESFAAAFATQSADSVSSLISTAVGDTDASGGFSAESVSSGAFFSSYSLPTLAATALAAVVALRL